MQTNAHGTERNSDTDSDEIAPEAAPVRGIGTLEIREPRQFCGIVRARTIHVADVLDAHGIICDCLILDNGTLQCFADLHAHRISGNGCIRINGALECDSLDLTGDLETHGEIICSGTLNINGSLINTRRVTADTIILNGACKGRELDGRNLDIRPLNSNMFARFGMNRFDAGIEVVQINANQLKAQGLRCQSLKANKALLRNDSHVQSAICDAALGTDRTSSVVLVGGDCRRVHLKTA
ncbi:hypothetical protein [Bifidobacterium oedipodis]|uniref:Uncharacterized protein n=1 Tax=Bifidobacterium oedipodis TaxID=2675322 RepID=A0A7Y0ENK6_9BIFI|nr:hypothetical protein [Bifidobacterium sp. DSM 109957]NMM93564.1 hypothetical protein [Bifidobacterium sp. DSM 109957]